MGHPSTNFSFSVARPCSKRALDDISPEPSVDTVLVGLDTHEAVARIPLHSLEHSMHISFHE